MAYNHSYFLGDATTWRHMAPAGMQLGGVVYGAQYQLHTVWVCSWARASAYAGLFRISKSQLSASRSDPLGEVVTQRF